MKTMMSTPLLDNSNYLFYNELAVFARKLIMLGVLEGSYHGEFAGMNWRRMHDENLSDTLPSSWPCR
jgi:hypothetical protein